MTASEASRPADLIPEKVPPSHTDQAATCRCVAVEVEKSWNNWTTILRLSSL